MATLNTVLLMGNLTRDPEIRYTTGGAAVCNFGMAMNSRYTTAQGETREEVCFVDVEVWGKQAEALQRYKRKGETVFVEGRLKTDSWQDRETNQKRTRLSVRAERVQFIGSAREAGTQEEQLDGSEPYSAPNVAPQGNYNQNNRGYGAPAPQAGGYSNKGSQPYPPRTANAMPAAPSFGAKMEPKRSMYDDVTPGAVAPIFETIDEPEDDIPF